MFGMRDPVSDKCRTSNDFHVATLHDTFCLIDKHG